MTNPFISILLPVRNEAAHITNTLECICSQDYPASRFEIIVVDGCSEDDTAQKVDQFIRENPGFSISLHQNEKKIFSTGFNLGMRSARGEVILMLGGHTEILPGYLRSCVEALHEFDAECVGGHIETISLSRSSQAIALAMSSPFGVGNVAFRTRPDLMAEVDTVAFAAYCASVFQRVGLLDEEMIRNQDDEFNYRLLESGGKILLIPTIRCRYFSRSGFSSLWRQYFQYGLWKVRVLQKHPRQMRLRQFIPPLFIAALTGSLILMVFTALAMVPHALIAGSYAAANLIASAFTAKRHGWQHFYLLPLAFATLHFGYGSGFLTGLAKFWNRWGDKLGEVPEYRPSHARSN